MEDERDVWQLLGPEGVGLPAVVHSQNAFPQRDVLEEVRAIVEPEEKGVDEVHRRGKVELVDVDWGPRPRSGVYKGEKAVVEQGLRDVTHILRGLEVRFGVDVGDHAFLGGVRLAVGHGEHAWYTIALSKKRLKAVESERKVPVVLKYAIPIILLEAAAVDSAEAPIYTIDAEFIGG